MAFQFGDTGAHYALADIGKKWTAASNISSISATGNPFGGPAIVTGFNGSLAKTFSSGQTSWVACMRGSFSAMAAGIIMEMVDLASGSQVDLRLTAAGALQVTRNGTVLGTSSAALLVPSTFYHIQFKVTINATTGTYAVRLNGLAPTGLPDATGQNTKAQTASTADTVRFRSPGGVNLTACDFYICDLTGTSNNDFPGDVRGVALLPTGAGNYTQWTPLSGANYTNVDESSFNSDTDYNSSGTVNQIDSYTMGDLASGYSVVAVQTVLGARKDDAGSRIIAPVLRQGATDYVGNNANLLDSYTFFTQPLDKDPTDNAAWTAAKVNSIELGAKVIS